MQEVPCHTIAVRDSGPVRLLNFVFYVILMHLCRSFTANNPITFAVNPSVAKGTARTPPAARAAAAQLSFSLRCLLKILLFICMVEAVPFSEPSVFQFHSRRSSSCTGTAAAAAKAATAPPAAKNSVCPILSAKTRARPKVGNRPRAPRGPYTSTVGSGNKLQYGDTTEHSACCCSCCYSSSEKQ